ncbi:transcription antitermination factor NusB [Robiginitomaculum antarcticum]|uniref:transcription antitermination factor NusB n=1 Tax=Robiginitomaculum antarcticum TaxID=437507 RepID=UPI00035DF580|nr:transcription antitermination factor NusB [Robiginitomaculum antarcticum]
MDVTSELRGASRLAAVQALYQMELSGQGAGDVVMQFRNKAFGYDGEKGYKAADEEFFEELVRGVVREQNDIDAKIAVRLNQKWRLSRLDTTLRAIMRAAVFELAYRVDVPAKVVIDEYVTLSMSFYDGPEPKFVNASLDNLARDVRASEFSA